MKTIDCVNCTDFPCLDTNRTGYLIPSIKLDVDRVSILLISEAAPQVLWRFCPL